MNEVIVIGGGAAGMMAAAAAAENGARVTLFEKNEKLGKKIYITGKGRCNATNACDREDFFGHVVTNPRFLYSSFGKWNNWDMMDFLEREGTPLKTERGNRVFPVSDKASDITRALQHAMSRRGVRWRLNAEVLSLKTEELPVESGTGRHGKIPAERICRGVVMDDGTAIPADAVIVATGGLAYPSTGSTGDGYRWAEENGIAVRHCVPSLVPFNAVIGSGIPCRELQGLSLRNVSVDITENGSSLAGGFGELLFTHFGVSGPLILSASSLISAKADHPLNMRIDLKPALTEEQLDARLLRELAAGANREMKNLLGKLYPSRLISVILQLTEIPAEKCGRELTREERQKLVRVTKAFPVTLLSVRGFSEAVITQGGISVKEIEPGTMESRRVMGLYFAGEVLDVDAYTGGYNLQIAWTTGHAAGTAAASGERKK